MVQKIFPAIILGFWLLLPVPGHADKQAAAIHLDVHKSPTCGCCTLWMDHMAEYGFTTTGYHP